MAERKPVQQRGRRVRREAEESDTALPGTTTQAETGVEAQSSAQAQVESEQFGQELGIEPDQGVDIPTFLDETDVGRVPGQGRTEAVESAVAGTTVESIKGEGGTTSSPLDAMTEAGRSVTAQQGRASQLQDLAGRAGIGTSGGSSSATGNIGRVTVGRGEGKANVSRQDMLSSDDDVDRSQDGGTPTDAAGVDRSQDGGTAQDAAGVDRSQDGGTEQDAAGVDRSQDGGGEDTSDPYFGFGSQEAFDEYQERVRVENQGGMTDKEFADYSDRVRSENQGGMDETQLNAYKAVIDYDTIRRPNDLDVTTPMTAEEIAQTQDLRRASVTLGRDDQRRDYDPDDLDSLTPASAGNTEGNIDPGDQQGGLGDVDTGGGLGSGYGGFDLPGTHRGGDPPDGDDPVTIGAGSAASVGSEARSSAPGATGAGLLAGAAGDAARDDGFGTGSSAGGSSATAAAELGGFGSGAATTAESTVSAGAGPVVAAAGDGADDSAASGLEGAGEEAELVEFDSDLDVGEPLGTAPSADLDVEDGGEDAAGPDEVDAPAE